MLRKATAEQHWLEKRHNAGRCCASFPHTFLPMNLTPDLSTPCYSSSGHLLSTVCQPCCADCFGFLMGTNRDQVQTIKITFLEEKKTQLYLQAFIQIMDQLVFYGYGYAYLKAAPQQKVLYRKPGLQRKCILCWVFQVYSRYLLYFHNHKLNQGLIWTQGENFTMRTARQLATGCQAGYAASFSGRFLTDKLAKQPGLISQLTLLWAGGVDYRPLQVLSHLTCPMILC